MIKTIHLSQFARPVRLPLGRRGWLVAGFALVAAGAAFNWGWLTAVGLAPLILALAPCTLICALGLCAMGGSKSCAAEGGPPAGRDGADKRAAAAGESEP